MTEPDPYRRARYDELREPLLPRWFVVLAVLTVPAAVVVFVVAFLVLDTEEIAVAKRRPPPAGGLTADPGEYAVGTADPVEWDAPAACAELGGVRIAGASEDLEVLDGGLRALCGADLGGEQLDRLRAFADAGGVVRFAAFEATGLDVASTLADPAAEPLVLVNGRFTQGDPGWIAPLLVLETTFVDADPASAEGVLAARRAEAAVCDELFAGERRPSRACEDAWELRALDDPVGALRDAGFR